MKYFKATDSNGTEVYLFPLEDGSFVAVPKEQLEFKPLSPEELKEMADLEIMKSYCDKCKHKGTCHMICPTVWSAVWFAILQRERTERSRR